MRAIFCNCQGERRPAAHHASTFVTLHVTFCAPNSSSQADAWYTSAQFRLLTRLRFSGVLLSSCVCMPFKLQISCNAFDGAIA